MWFKSAIPFNEYVLITDIMKTILRIYCNASYSF